MDDPLSDFVHSIHLTQDQLTILKKEYTHKKHSLQRLLIDLTFLSKEELLKKMAYYFDIPYVDLKIYTTTLFPEINNLLAPLHGFLFSKDNKSLFIAIEDANDVCKKDLIKNILKKNNCLQDIQWFYGNYDFIEQQNKLFQVEIKEETYTNNNFYFFLKEAVHLNASDIHLHGQRNILKLFYRMNGQMVLQKTWHRDEQSALINRLKVIAHLDIAQNRIDQSGHFEYLIEGRRVHFRISSHPTLHGESIAIRILDLDGKRKQLAQLGLPENHLEKFKNALTMKTGVILVGGSTGSGKTTTLYAALDFLSHHKLNILTLEDPIECHLDYALQTEISELFSYRDGIKSILRQDPDVLLIGEIRDEETAMMVFRAAMTEHLILSTIHARNVLAISDRLKDLGISQNMIDNFLCFSLFQELIPEHHNVCVGKGCAACFNTGISKRSIKSSII
jgi:type II secretory ATPase GspE/PulE/Tfp pilus assembly ATPase PilB-like protein